MKKLFSLLASFLVLLTVFFACAPQEDIFSGKVESMTFSEDVPYSVDEGQMLDLYSYLQITPEGVADTVAIQWTSSNPIQATVSEGGTVNALREGNVTITASAQGIEATTSLIINKVTIKEFSIPANFEVYVGSSVRFPINDLKPKTAPLYRFKWESTNDGPTPKLQDGNWYLKADEERTYTLTASVDKADEATCQVTFVKPSISKAVFSPNSFTLEQGATQALKNSLQLTAADGFKADTVKVTWSSNKAAVASVDASGNVTAIAAGKATITAMAGSKRATCSITVTAKQGGDPADPSDPSDPSDPDTPVTPSEKEFVVSFNSNGGTGSMQALTVAKGKGVTLTANTFQRSGYRFDSWNTASNGSGTKYADKATITPTDNVTLYAQWVATCTISFNANGGLGSMETVTVDKGKSFTLPSNSFTKSGDTFSGWNTASNGSGTSYSNMATITVNSNITLYAQWKTYYTITFNANGGSGTMNSVKVEKGKSITLPKNTFTLTGELFEEWNTMRLGTGTSYADGATITPTSNITLFVQWLDLYGTEAGYDWKDMGLPSGVRWATKNVGASKVGYSGSYVAWGEVASKSSYTTANYTYSGTASTLPEANDCASVKMGGNWRMPTEEEWNELMTYCDWEWQDNYGGYKGYRVSSRTSDNALFIRAAGYYDGTSFKNGYEGYYWLPAKSGSSAAKAIKLTSTSRTVTTQDRYKGLCVIAVSPRK